MTFVEVDVLVVPLPLVWENPREAANANAKSKRIPLSFIVPPWDYGLWRERRFFMIAAPTRKLIHFTWAVEAMTELAETLV
jgi:hypothetical protein